MLFPCVLCSQSQSLVTIVLLKRMFTTVPIITKFIRSVADVFFSLSAAACEKGKLRFFSSVHVGETETCQVDRLVVHHHCQFLACFLMRFPVRELMFTATVPQNILQPQNFLEINRTSATLRVFLNLIEKKMTFIISHRISLTECPIGKEAHRVCIKHSRFGIGVR